MNSYEQKQADRKERYESRSAWVRQLTANGRYSTNRVISKLDELSV